MKFILNGPEPLSSPFILHFSPAFKAVCPKPAPESILERHRQKRIPMESERAERHGGARPALANLAAIGSVNVIAAFCCCLPHLSFVAAAGFAGGSAFGWITARAVPGDAERDRTYLPPARPEMGSEASAGLLALVGGSAERPDWLPCNCASAAYSNSKLPVNRSAAVKHGFEMPLRVCSGVCMRM